MAWLAVNENGAEFIWNGKPLRGKYGWGSFQRIYTAIRLPHNTIKKLIGRELTFADEPVELKEE